MGRSKVSSAAGILRELNSEVRIVEFEESFGVANARRIVLDWKDEEGGPEEGPGGRGGGGRGWDIVLDCTDNPATRYLISDACVLAGKVLVSGAAQRTDGQLMVLNFPPRATRIRSPSQVGGGDGAEESQKGPCYRCVFPVPPAPETVQSCAEVGVLGPVVGVVGVLMAMEVVKWLVRTDDEAREWKPSLLLYSGMSRDPRAVWRSVGLRGQRRDCVVCGDDELLKGKGRITWDGLEGGKVDYEDFCGRVQDVAVLGRENRVAAAHFVETMMERDSEDARRDQHHQQLGDRPLVVDVREEAEFALGAKVQGSVNVPISRILRRGAALQRRDENEAKTRTEEDELFKELVGPGVSEGSRPIYFVCQRGNDSQIAARQFLDAGSGGRSGSVSGQTRWIGDVVGGFDALEKQANL